jgi:hypothetical protein
MCFIERPINTSRSSKPPVGRDQTHLLRLNALLVPNFVPNAGNRGESRGR